MERKFGYGRTITICCPFASTKEVTAFTAFQRLFEERGLPDAIRTDNGLPFASPNGLYNLSKLSVWWLVRVSMSNVSDPATRNRMVAMNACI